MADCVDNLLSIGFDACTPQVGGVNKRVWLTQKEQISGTTKDSDGYVNTITMASDGSADYKLITVTGKKFKNSGAFELVVGDNVNLVKHTAVVACYPTTPAQRDALLVLLNADEMVAIFETEDGKIEIYGLDKGMEASALTGGTGTLLQDDKAVVFTMAGDQTRLPEFFLDTDLATSIAYLDNITAPVV
jgi:hypothetical protein